MTATGEELTTAAIERVPGDILLVGRLPFDDVKSALRASAEGLRGYASMVPDGDVGPRKMWGGFVRKTVFSDTARGGETEWMFTVKPGDDLRFDDLHYGQAAIDSYRSSVDRFFPDPAVWPTVKRAYIDALGREVEKMLTVIPAESLAIQYDLEWEVFDVSLGTETFIPSWPRQTVEEKFARHSELLPDLARTVPEDVLLGYHSCYGTAVRAADRPVDYVHMPVVKHPAEEFFAPLENLDVEDTTVFLGIIHHADGADGFKQRLELAGRHLSEFGVASVCGYDRVAPAELPTILRVHRECADLLPGRTC